MRKIIKKEVLDKLAKEYHGSKSWRKWKAFVQKQDNPLAWSELISVERAVDLTLDVIEGLGEKLSKGIKK